MLGFHEQIEGHTPEMLAMLSQEELYRKYQALDDIAQLSIGDRLGELILTDAEIAAVLPAVRGYYAEFFSIHEAHQAKEILAADDPWALLESYPLFPRYEVLAETQGEAMGLSPDDTLAFVGCGALPLSLILMGRLFGARSIGLDIDPAAVSLAERCIERLGLADVVSIVHGDESRLAELPFTGVLIAALAEPKRRIFRTLRTIMQAREVVPVVFRTYTGIRTVLYGPVEPGDYQGYTIVRQIEPSRRVNNTLVFLEMDADV